MMFVSWTVSFLGIKALYVKLDQPKCALNSEVASTFFIFSISVLSDFLIRKEKRKNFFSRLIYCIIFCSFTYVALVCIAAFTGSEISLQCWDIVYTICFVFLIILGIDAIVLYLFPPYEYEDINIKNNENNTENLKKKYVEKFETSLQGKLK